MSFTASIYLHEEERFVSCPIKTNDPWEAQAIAEAIALCHGAPVRNPDKAVFGIRPFLFINYTPKEKTA